MKAGILLLIIFVLQFSCLKDKPFMNDGVITGFDGGQIPCVAGCICSGGLFFHFTNTGDNTGKKLYNPEIFKLPSNPHFPILVKIDWENIIRCGDSAIQIKRYMIL
jgi:hypothetical protein